MARQGPGLPSTERAWAKSNAGRSSFGRGDGGGTRFGVSEHFAGFSIFAAGLNELTVGLIALKGAVALASTGFEVLAKSATELVGAIAQLGGAKGIQQMFVESVTNQSLMNQTRFAVSGEERSTGRELMDLTAKLSENAETGAFDRKEWLQTIKQIGIVTGHQRSLDEGTLGTLGKFAVVTGSSIEDQGQIFSRLQAQNRGMNNDQIIQLMLNLHAVGQRGSFSEAELAKSPNLLGLRGMFSGNAGTIENLLGTVGSAFVGSGAAENQNEAGTIFSSILNAAMRSKNPMWHRSGVTGQFGDPADILKDLVNTDQTTLEGELSKSGLHSTPLQKAVRGSVYLREQISQSAGAQNTEDNVDKEKRARFIDDMINMHYTMEQLNAEFDQTRGPQERFRAAFNRISDHLEAKFLGTLERMQPALDAFANIIISHESDIGEFFDQLAVWLGVAITKLPVFIDVVEGLGLAVGHTIEYILNLIGVSTDPEHLHKSINDRNKFLGQVEAGTAFATPEKIKQLQDQNAQDQARLALIAQMQELSPENLAKAREDEERKQHAAREQADFEADVAKHADRVPWAASHPSGAGKGGESTFAKDLAAAIKHNTIELQKNTHAMIHETSAPAAPQPSQTGR
jgi:hypothetical protein